MLMTEKDRREWRIKGLARILAPRGALLTNKRFSVLSETPSSTTSSAPTPVGYFRLSKEKSTLRPYKLEWFYRMVNPGHPSKGCTTCRTRRIKCDEKRPSCANCVKSQRICLGYMHRLASGTRERTTQLKTANTNSESDHQKHLVMPVVDRFINTNYEKSTGERFTRALSEPVILCVKDAMSAGFESLCEPYQTFEDRRKLHKRYQSAIRGLRNELSSGSSPDRSFESVLLFAIYEMTVNIDQNDRTWLMHLDGLLALLKESHSDAARSLTLHKSIQHVYSLRSAIEDTLESTLNEMERACILLDISKLRLKRNVLEVEELLSSTTHPRQLDLQRIRTAVKRVYRDLVALPWHSQSTEADLSTRCMEYWALLIIAASILLQVSQPMKPSGSAKGSHGRRKLIHTAAVAAESIYTSSLSMLRKVEEASIGVAITVDAYGLGISPIISLIWPLYCASLAPGIATIRQQQVRSLLWRVGEVARIPKAMSLVSDEHTEVSLLEAVSGLILLGPFTNIARE